MQLNFPSRVRQVVYAFATVASPTMVYLNQQDIVNNFWYGLYGILISAVTGLALVNVSNKEETK